MNIKGKIKEELINKLEQLFHEIDSSKALKEKREAAFLPAHDKFYLKTKRKKTCR